MKLSGENLKTIRMNRGDNKNRIAMKIRFCQWVGLCLLLLFSACSKNNRYVNVLPADASCVVSAHLPVLIEKAVYLNKILNYGWGR